MAQLWARVEFVLSLRGVVFYQEMEVRKRVSPYWLKAHEKAIELIQVEIDNKNKSLLIYICKYS